MASGPPSFVNAYELPTNWTPAAVPTGTAFFGATPNTSITINNSASVGGWTFNAGASAYTFSNTSSFFQFTGAGIVVNGGSVTYESQGPGLGAVNGLEFDNASTAGNAKFYIGSGLGFANSSSAANSTIDNAGSVGFGDSSTAANASIINESGAVTFSNTSTAGNASITNDRYLQFRNNSTGGNASITNGGPASTPTPARPR